MGQVARYSVDIVTSVVPASAGSMDRLIEQVAESVYGSNLDAAIGGDVDARTIGITASVEKETHVEALQVVLEVFRSACIKAGLTDESGSEKFLGAVNVVRAVATAA